MRSSSNKSLGNRSQARGKALVAKAAANNNTPNFSVAVAEAASSSSSVAAGALPQHPEFTYAPGEAGKIARSFVEKSKHPTIVVQDPKGLHKPICHEFKPKHGRSTYPFLMLGHPDDFPGGPFVSNEASIHERFRIHVVRTRVLGSEPKLLRTNSTDAR